jgi:hypothetical protein
MSLVLLFFPITAIALQEMEPIPNAKVDSDILTIAVKSTFSNGEEYNGSMYGAAEPAESVHVRVYVSKVSQISVIFFRVNLNGDIVRDDPNRILVWEKKLHQDNYSGGILIDGLVQGIHLGQTNSTRVYEYSCLVILDFEPIPLDPLSLALFFALVSFAAFGTIFVFYKWHTKIEVIEE